jgi:hypothetical protein
VQPQPPVLAIYLILTVFHLDIAEHKSLMSVSLLNKISNRLLLHNVGKLPHYTPDIVKSLRESNDDFTLVLKPLGNDNILEIRRELDIVAGFYNDSDEPIKISVFQEDKNVFHPYTETTILPKKFAYALDDKFVIPTVYTPYQFFRIDSSGAAPLVVGALVNSRDRHAIFQPHFGFSKDMKEYFYFRGLFDMTYVKPSEGVQIPDMRGVPLVLEGVVTPDRMCYIEQVVKDHMYGPLSSQTFPKLVQWISYLAHPISDSFVVGNANNRNDLYSKGTHTLIIALSDVEGGDMVFEEGYDVKLKRGDAVIFDNRARFLCTPIEHGNKLILSCQINV